MKVRMELNATDLKRLVSKRIEELTGVHVDYAKVSIQIRLAGNQSLSALEKSATEWGMAEFRAVYEKED